MVKYKNYAIQLLEKVTTTLELLELTTMALPEYRKGAWDEPDIAEITERRNRFAATCWRAYKNRNPGVDDTTLEAQQEFQDDASNCAPTAKKARTEIVKGMSELQIAMGQKLDEEKKPSSKAAVVKAVAKPKAAPKAMTKAGQRQTIKVKLHAQAAAYHDILKLGSYDNKDPLAWWREAFKNGHYPYLKPGIRLLLSFGSGNAFLERCFSYAEMVTADKRRASYDLRRHMLLRVGGLWARIADYLPFAGK